MRHLYLLLLHAEKQREAIGRIPVVIGNENSQNSRGRFGAFPRALPKSGSTRASAGESENSLPAPCSSLIASIVPP